MDTRLLSSARAHRCVRCGTALAAGEPVWWDPAARTASCARCHDDRPQLPDRAPVVPSARTIEPVARHDHASSYDGADSRNHDRGERWRQELSGRGVVIDDRRVPGRRDHIDHIIVTRCGVSVVDVKAYRAKVQKRMVGGWFAKEERLFVAGRDKTLLVEGLAWQLAEVTAVLDDAGLPRVPVHPMLCFTDADWGLFGHPQLVRGVWVGPAMRVTEAALTHETSMPWSVADVARALEAQATSVAAPLNCAL